MTAINVVCLVLALTHPRASFDEWTFEQRPTVRAVKDMFAVCGEFNQGFCFSGSSDDLLSGWSPALVVHVHSRADGHGEERVTSMSLRLRLRADKFTIYQVEPERKRDH
jgi:hypothetical protein